MGTEKAATSCRTLEYKMALKEKVSPQIADDFIKDCLYSSAAVPVPQKDIPKNAGRQNVLSRYSCLNTKDIF